MTHYCPTGCGQQAATGNLMCRDCWFQVPATLRTQVWRTFREWQRTHGDVEFEAYDQAREAAIASVP